MSRKKHVRLRKEIAASTKVNGQADLANKIQLSPCGLSNKLKGAIPWKLYECYQIMDILKLPPEQITVFFPVEDQSIVTQK